MNKQVRPRDYARTRRDVPRHWAPLERATVSGGENIETIRIAMAHYGWDEATARAKLDEDCAKCEYWINHLYQVEKRPYSDNIVQLNIRRRDGAADVRDWRHFQAIKNQLVGEECEAIELYPAESRKVDTSNKWHLWCVTDPTFRFPVGWTNRDVTYEGGKSPGVKQRPL